MKNQFATLISVLFLFVGLCLGKGMLSATPLSQPTPSPTVVTAPAEDNRIQLAILLDVSGSMSGLIEQAKTQLWRVVNELAYARRGTYQPELEIALYSYGNNQGARGIPYITQLTPFTSDLDLISQRLFALSTSGSEEYCGQVIQLSVDQLAWSESPDDLKVVFIAGNEPFTQGPVPYAMACKAAGRRDIVVNTVYCGAYQEGVNSGWKNGAELTGGRYLHINHNQQTTFISTPYDDQLESLNQKLNDTYLFYGSMGRSYKQNQVTQDNNARSYAQANLATRAMSKANGLYNCEKWDLVDASQGKNPVKLDTVNRAFLPESFQNMNTKELEEAVAEKAERRAEITEEIRQLNEARETFIRDARKAEGEESTLDKAMLDAIREQGKKKSLVFEKS
jgi:hypothetical protein